MPYIDELLIAHAESCVAAEHVKLLDGACGNQDPLTTSRGKAHECLDMSIFFLSE